MVSIRGLIRQCILSLIDGDGGKYPRAQITYNGATGNAMRFSPFGLYAQPKEGSLGLVLAPHGRIDQAAALFMEVNERFKDLQQGEVLVGNADTKAFIKFKEDGSIEVDTDQKVTIRAASGVEVTGDLTVAGNVDVTGEVAATVDVKGGPAQTSLIGHTHTITGGSSAGTTTPPI